MTDDRSAILAANAAFYAAFSTGNIAALARLWADDDAISCIHPGWPVIIGRDAVIGSWGDILRSVDRPQITCRDPYAIVTGNGGWVLCVEIIETAALAASNHFRRIDGVWRLVHHQASPIAQGAFQAIRDRRPPGGQIH
jgi:ketosteroid isomerase-like protein